MTNENAVIPDWQIQGDWFDVCSCNIPCPCTFAQPPTNRACDVLFAYRIRSGNWGDTDMAGLCVLIIGAFTGSLFEGDQIDAGVLWDASANEVQLQALQQIFTGQAGGWMGEYIPMILGHLRGAELAKISCEIDDDLEHWRIEVPDVIRAEGKALTGPTANPAKRVQTINPPGSEVGPTNEPVTWGSSVEGYWNAFGFSQDIPKGQNSKHIPFDWSGPR